MADTVSFRALTSGGRRGSARALRGRLSRARRHGPRRPRPAGGVLGHGDRRGDSVLLGPSGRSGLILGRVARRQGASRARRCSIRRLLYVDGNDADYEATVSDRLEDEDLGGVVVRTREASRPVMAAQLPTGLEVTAVLACVVDGLGTAVAVLEPGSRCASQCRGCEALRMLLRLPRRDDECGPCRHPDHAEDPSGGQSVAVTPARTATTVSLAQASGRSSSARTSSVGERGTHTPDRGGPLRPHRGRLVGGRAVLSGDARRPDRPLQPSRYHRGPLDSSRLDEGSRLLVALSDLERLPVGTTTSARKTTMICLSRLAMRSR